MAIPVVSYSDVIRLRNVGPQAEKEWVPVMTDGKVKTVKSFHKGLAQKFEVVFESGHVCAGKPILPENLWSLQHYKTVSYEKLSSRQQRGLRRAEWEFQGWSEIVSYHVDKILGFHKKPPIVGRQFSSSVLYANDPTWTGWLKRLGPSYNIPLALLPWVDGLQRGIPDLDTRDFLIGNRTQIQTTTSRSFIAKALDVADKLVFDFLLDDHDTQGTQNWKADMAGNLLHWDSGLGWRDGPFSRSGCFDILCGTKQWKGVEHHDANPEKCDRICTFRKSTIDSLRVLDETVESDKKLSGMLLSSLQEDPLFPVFDKALWHYYTYDKDGNRKKKMVTHVSAAEFFVGMDTKISKLLAHVSRCEEDFGYDMVYQE